MKTLTRPRFSDLEEIPQFPASDPEHIKLLEQWLYVNPELSIEQAARIAAHGKPPVSGGAVQTDQVVIQNVPVGAPFEFNPARFFVATEQNRYKAGTLPFAADTPWNPFQLPAVGVYGKLVLRFEGTVTVGTANATTTSKWPYGLLDAVAFTANGQDDLFNCQGMALKALEKVRYPYMPFANGDTTGPGTGSGLTLAVGATTVRLTWELPLAFDESSMVASVFAQSRQLNLLLKGKDAPVAQVATAGGGGTVTIAGTWHISIETYQIPVDDQGKLVLPDLRYLHGFNELVTPFSNVGDVRTGLIRVNGTLQRIFSQAIQNTAAPPDLYNALTEVDEYRLEFGGNKRPKVYNPAGKLTTRNAKDYGDALPYQYVCEDFARYNALRDAVNIAGVTEMFWITDIADAAAPVAAQHRVTQETLFQ